MYRNIECNAASTPIAVSMKKPTRLLLYLLFKREFRMFRLRCVYKSKVVMFGDAKSEHKTNTLIIALHQRIL